MSRRSGFHGIELGKWRIPSLVSRASRASPSSTLLDGLVAYYKLDNALDSLGISDLTNNGGVTFIPGLVGNCASFTPTKSLSHIASAQLNVGNIDFTIDCAVQLASKATFRVFGSQFVNAGQYAWALYYDQGTDRFTFATSNDGTAFFTVAASTFGSPSINTWYYVRAVHNSVTDKILISVNNGEENVTSFSGGVKVSTDPFMIGNGIGLPHSGLVDEFGFWKRTLTDLEKAERYNGGSLSTYPFDPAYDTGLSVSYVSTDANGVKLYSATSTFNADGNHAIRVLEPDNPAVGMPHKFIYVLPVEAELNSVFGDGLETLRLLDAHNDYNATIVAPSFKLQPWYANHATDPNYRYEDFMTLELQPWTRQTFSQSGSEKNWLLGFSKSGLGGMGLLLKHPDLFDLGAFWDFPASMVAYTDNGANLNYGTQTNYDNWYKLSAGFLNTYKAPFTTANRIWINGYNLYQAGVNTLSANMTTAGIQHTIASEVLRDHIWGSGWVPVALSGLQDLSVL